MALLVIQPGPVDGKDTYTDQDNPATNYGTLVNFKMDGDPNNYAHVKFNIAAYPQLIGATINTALVKIYVSVNTTSSGRRCYRVTSAWDEATLTWNTNPTIDELLDSTSSNGPGWKTWDLKTWLENVLAGTWVNYGNQYREVSGNRSVCHSSDYLTDPSLRPKLEIDYTPAAPPVPEETDYEFGDSQMARLDSYHNADNMFIKMTRFPFFIDQFEGADFTERWVKTLVGTGEATPDDGQQAVLGGSALNDEAGIDWGGKKNIQLSSLPDLRARGRILHLTDIRAIIELKADATNYLRFVYDSSVDGNWHVETSRAGSTDNQDTGIVATTTRMKFRIVWISNTQVDFYINDVKVKTLTDPSDIPANGDVTGVEPRLYSKILAAAANELMIEYLTIRYAPRS